MAAADGCTLAARGEVAFLLVTARYKPRVSPSPESRPPAGGPAQNGARADEAHWFAAVAPGLEEVLRAEVQRLPGATLVNVVTGGVEFVGPHALGLIANQRLRTASRVLLRLGKFSARAFSQMRRRAAPLDWGDFIDKARPVRFEVTAQKSRLYHSGAVTEVLGQAVGDRLGGPVAIAKGAAGAESTGTRDDGAADEEVDVQRVFARGVRDEWTISIDASGALLHRRGWRAEAGEAPLRETLAAGLLGLAGYDPRRPLVDLMCGSGTIAIEAAGMALGRDPGARRHFACEDWPLSKSRPARRQGVARASVNAAGTTPPVAHPADACAAILGFDQDEAMLAIAERNGHRASVAEAIEWRKVRWPARGENIGMLPPGPGLVLVNPPYGRRLSDQGRAAALIRMLGRELRVHFAGWRAGVLLADPSWSAILGIPVTATHTLQNGGLRVTFVVVEVPR